MLVPNSNAGLVGNVAVLWWNRGRPQIPSVEILIEVAKGLEAVSTNDGERGRCRRLWLGHVFGVEST
eukprot:scaffold18615_cov83-Isochrysis_galbana.AAC.2